MKWIKRLICKRNGHVPSFMQLGSILCPSIQEGFTVCNRCTDILSGFSAIVMPSDNPQISSQQAFRLSVMGLHR